MERVAEYRLVDDPDPRILEAAVNELIRGGRQPLGGPDLVS